MTGIRIALLVLAALLAPPSVAGSVAAAQSTAPPATAGATTDTLGRDTPRGTLFGFMDAARKGNLELAALYLNTPRGADAAKLASQLFVVLDTRLPARLQEVSDDPAGSRVNPLKPDQDIVGAIQAETGNLDILVEHVSRGTSSRVWLFARATLDQIPAVYDEGDLVSLDRYLPGWLGRPRIAGIRLFHWFALVLVVPVLYLALGSLSRIVPVPGPVRLLLIAVVIRTVMRLLELPLVERQFWMATTATLFVAAIVWLVLSVGRIGERSLLKRIGPSTVSDPTSLLRLGRHVLDVLVVATGALVLLHYFGIDATAALAGLGIGGIAIALSAQKTLENVIGGVSIIFDGAVKVGEFVRIGDKTGMVEHVGLRSTRIRTLDRTLLTIPNGQMATLNIETVSNRDKFWCHHFIGVTYDTTADQLKAITGDVRELLLKLSRADDSSIRVRVVRFAPSSIDIELSAYLFAQDWDNFLEMQEALLLEVMAIVVRRGSSMAFPTQTVHVAGVGAPVP
jgi:MscS family membrane protein